MSKIFCVVIVAIGILHSGVVQLSSSKDVCEEFTNFTSDIPLEDLHVNTSLQMCLGFTCPNVTLINEDFNYTPRASGFRSIGAFDNMESTFAQWSYTYGQVEPLAVEQAWNDSAKQPGAYTIEIYPLIHKNTPLFGWFHIKLTIVGGRMQWDQEGLSYVKDIEWFVHQVQTNSTNKVNQRNHIFGDYVHGGFEGDCVTKGKFENTVIQLTREGTLPSFTAQNPSPVMSQGFGFTHSMHTQNRTRLTEAHFNWKTNFPLCPIFSRDPNDLLADRGVLFRAFVQGFRSAGGPGYITDFRGKIATTRVITLQDYVYGGHDPSPPSHSSPTCSQPCSGSKPSWVENCSGDKSLFWMEKDGIDNVFKLNRTCTSVVESNPFSRRRFYGRCDLQKSAGGGKQEYPSPSAHYSCDITNDFYEKLQSHREYLRAREPFDVDGREKGIRQAIIACHGVVMMIVTIVLMPVGNFVARYYKESFIRKRLMQVHAWYQLHIQLYSVSLVLLVVGLVIIKQIDGIPSPSPGNIFTSLHNGFGVLATILFFLVFLISWLRTHRFGILNCTVGFHTVGGYVCYGLCLFDILLVFFMKNPTPVTSVFSNRELVGGVKISWIFIPLFLLWIVFVVSLNIYMSFSIRFKDKESAVEGTRTWILKCIPLPTVTFDAEADVPGTKKRLILGILYATMCGACGLIFAALLCFGYFT